MVVSVQALRGVHDGQRSSTVVDADALPNSSTSPARKATCASWRRTKRSSTTCNASSPPARPAPPRPSRKPPMLADNSHHLAAAARQRHNDAHQRTQEVIRVTAARGDAVTVTGVAAPESLAPSSTPTPTSSTPSASYATLANDPAQPRPGNAPATPPCCAASTPSPNATRNSAPRTRTSDGAWKSPTASSVPRTRVEVKR